MPKKLGQWKPPRFASPPVSRGQAHYRTADWKAKRIRIAIRDAYICRECGMLAYGKDGHADHIVPLEEGGSDTDSNLAWMCSRCHGRKTNREQRRRGIL